MTEIKFIQTWEVENLPNYIHTHNRVTKHGNSNIWEAVCKNEYGSAESCGFGGFVEGYVDFVGFVDIKLLAW